MCNGSILFQIAIYKELDNPPDSLNIFFLGHESMSINTNDTKISGQITKDGHDVSKKAVGILLLILAIGVFTVGFDQGEVFGVTVPADGSGGVPGTNWSHEFYHDMRHAAGFPCH